MDPPISTAVVINVSDDDIPETCYVYTEEEKKVDKYLKLMDEKYVKLMKELSRTEDEKHELELDFRKVSFMSRNLDKEIAKQSETIARNSETIEKLTTKRKKVNEKSIVTYEMLEVERELQIEIMGHEKGLIKIDETVQMKNIQQEYEDLTDSINSLIKENKTIESKIKSWRETDFTKDTKEKYSEIEEISVKIETMREERDKIETRVTYTKLMKKKYEMERYVVGHKLDFPIEKSNLFSSYIEKIGEFVENHEANFKLKQARKLHQFSGKITSSVISTGTTMTVQHNAPRINNTPPPENINWTLMHKKHVMELYAVVNKLYCDVDMKNKSVKYFTQLKRNIMHYKIDMTRVSYLNDAKWRDLADINNLHERDLSKVYQLKYKNTYKEIKAKVGARWKIDQIDFSHIP